MRLVGFVGAGLLAVGCCCGDPRALLDRLRGAPAEPDVASPAAGAPAELPLPSQPVQVELAMGIPPTASQMPATGGAWMRYTAPISVERSRQFHDRWLRENGWSVQSDMQSARGWVLVATQAEHRVTIEIAAQEPSGVMVVFNLL